MSTASPSLILASSSASRRLLLSRLQYPFVCQAPDLDETPLPAETAPDLAARLAQAKALAIPLTGPSTQILGADQTASLEGLLLQKPLSRSDVALQLHQLSGHTVDFYTSVCLRTHSEITTAQDHTIVVFRALRPEEIASYIQREETTGCLGGFRCEGLGISLFSAIHTSDPTALIGLPLIATARLLHQPSPMLSTPLVADRTNRR